MPLNRLIAGAMSGTSADGVDVALTRITGDWPTPFVELLHHHHRPYDPAIRRAIFAIRSGAATTLADLADLGRHISLTYAAAVNEALVGAGLDAGRLDAVAAHGQTLYHNPPNTIQWFDPALVASLVGCPVISDFRRADCAVGGQGAPLVPLADYVLLRHPAQSRVLLNLGGIANLTVLPAGASLDDVIAFDTGPGNCISDYLCRKHEPDGPGYDPDGHIADTGTAHLATAHAVARCAYTFAPIPKSTDGPAMISAYESAKRASGFNGSFADELATACLITALSLQLSFDQFIPGWRDGRIDQLCITGGGVRNRCLMRYLRQHLLEPSPMRLVEPDATLIQAKEALAFAILGAATLDRIPGNVLGATGARRRVVLGSITPAP